jgi:DME family drug/metabolite transporter
LFVLAAAVLWGTTGTAQALAPEGAQPAAIGALRLAIGGIALLLLAGVRGALRSGMRWPPLTTALAGVSMAAYQICFFTGVTKTGVAVATIVAIGTAPILAGVLGFLVRGEHPGGRWGLATVLAVVGCSLLIAAGRGLNVHVLGVALALGAGGAYATYAVTSKGLLDDRPPDAVMAVVFCFGAVLLAPLLFVADLSWLAQPRGMVVVLHLGLVATAAAYALFARGLTAISVAAAVTLSLAEPLTAGTLGVVLLGEQLTTPALVGIGLILGGLVLLSLGGRIRSVKGNK